MEGRQTPKQTLRKLLKEKRPSARLESWINKQMKGPGEGLVGKGISITTGRDQTQGVHGRAPGVPSLVCKA